MAFSFGNLNNAMMGGSSGAAGGAGGLTQGADLEVIQTEGLGFLSIAGDAKVQLTSKWSPPPAPTASLISIAARKGLVAAAGPDAIHIATTESVRKAFAANKTGDSEVRPFEPQAKVPLPVRISQLAFTADEQYLVLSAETGGGLAAYDVQALSQGTTQSAFELSTNGETLRALVPNPMPEFGGFCAIVTNNGNLLMANLSERKLASGSNGPVLRAQVSCAAWSTKGKQLVAGMANGTIVQMTPDGTEKGLIPKPPSLGDYHVASVTWLENNVFLVIHNPTNGQDNSVYHVVTRQSAGGAAPSFTFQKITDPVEPFVADKAPHHSILRLTHFPPNLQDLLVVASTSNESIGLLSRSKTPLASDKPAEKITNVFTTTELADDSKRAQLPMSEDLTETFPVGVALDLSSKDKVYKPIPTDEIEQSPGPLPALWVLNNEGVLAAWWIVYNESIRSGTIYPGLAAAEGSGVANQATPVKSTSTGAFASPATSTPAPAFGAPASAATPPAFGGPATLGAKSSPWSTTPSTSAAAPSFGQTTFGSKPAAPAFGSPSLGNKPAAPAFGQSSSIGGLGARPSPWASGSAAAATPAFGQTGFASAAPAAPGKVFGSAAPAAAAAPGSGGFAGFANKNGFASLSGGSGGTNIFAKPAASSTPEVSMDTGTAFSAKPQGTSALASSPFVLGTTFKADPKTANDNEEPKEGAGSSLFGSGFGLSLTDAAKPSPARAPETKDEDMDRSSTPAPAPAPTPTTAVVPPTPAPAQEKPKSLYGGFESTTPTTTPAPQKFGFPATAGPTTSGSSIFGTKPAATSGSFPNLFGTPKPAPADTPKPKAPLSAIFGKIKKEEEDKENLADIPPAPLPPDTTTSKPQPKAEDAPLPPDFLSKKAAPAKAETTSLPPLPPLESKKAPDAAPLPPDFLPSKAKPAAKESKPPVAEDVPLPPVPVNNPFAKLAEQVPAVPDSDEEDEEDELSEEEDQEEGDEEGEEGEEEGDEQSEHSGVDVTKDLTEDLTNNFGSPPGFTPTSSFGGMAGSTFSIVSRSETEQQPRQLFGEISRNAPPLFPAKPAGPLSPRSPSPVRGILRNNNTLRVTETPRSVSTPDVASSILGRKTQALPQAQPQRGFGFSTTPQRAPLSAPPVDPNVSAQRKLADKRAAEEHLLVDPEDEGIQKILSAEIQPTLHIDEFLAVDSKLEMSQTKSGQEVPVACETLWRDINRMVDRLGMNSRSLQSFILGHTTQYKESGRHKEEMENPDEWVLVEAEDLGMIIENELARDLEDGRVKNVEQYEAAAQDLSRDLSKLRAKQEDMRKIIASHIDPDQLAVAKSMPLSAEQATQQNELRRAFTNFSKLLAEAEEALTMLKAKMASAGGANGKAAVPTVEAIMRTINKMTGMAEKRSGDIDVLENQMRRLRLGSAGPAGSPGPRSREGSPFAPATPQHKKSMSMSLFSPGSSRFRHSLSASVGSYSGGVQATPPRKKLSMFSEDEKKAVRQARDKRKGTLNLLRASLEKAGPNVSRLKDED
ncbi:hypothetical protein QBC46DRAFT_351247 [Diplogelasinospora grovesii]|uniref:Nucleoporin Nup159/Nup146 N-terminal domain-containing protein n=1 Tax=Diplogelasinospora grovesii TaxID=303347 RepID=A0AAN6S776_9PEZI|nr:hypothetical protein QBC46DRAFT_351247 [Diplogelasinospora grovesii]